MEFLLHENGIIQTFEVANLELLQNYYHFSKSDP